MWTDQQIRTFVAAVHKEFGTGWDLLVPRVQRALIAEKAFGIARGQARDAVDVAAMDALLEKMLIRAGLTESPAK